MFTGRYQGIKGQYTVWGTTRFQVIARLSQLLEEIPGEEREAQKRCPGKLCILPTRLAAHDRRIHIQADSPVRNMTDIPE